MAVGARCSQPHRRPRGTTTRSVARSFSCSLAIGLGRQVAGGFIGPRHPKWQLPSAVSIGAVSSAGLMLHSLAQSPSSSVRAVSTTSIGEVIPYPTTLLTRSTCLLSAEIVVGGSGKRPDQALRSTKLSVRQ